MVKELSIILGLDAEDFNVTEDQLQKIQDFVPQKIDFPGEGGSQSDSVDGLVPGIIISGSNATVIEILL